MTPGNPSAGCNIGNLKENIENRGRLDFPSLHFYFTHDSVIFHSNFKTGFMNRSIRPYLLKETNWKSVRETVYDVAVLPWGATEAHNFHLPYGTDTYLAEAVAAEAARKAWERGHKIIVLPGIPFGVNTGQIEIPLCVNMNPSTQLMVLKDILHGLQHHKIRKLVILNAHGGNHFKQMIRELYEKFPDVFVAALNWWEGADRKDFFENLGDHADEMETSTMMHLFPELVLPLEEAGKGSSFPYRIRALRDGWVTTQRLWHLATEDTGVGDPAASSAEKGEKFFEAMSGLISAFLSDLAAADPDDLYDRPET